jgi:hypothetical protein
LPALQRKRFIHFSTNSVTDHDIFVAVSSLPIERKYTGNILLFFVRTLLTIFSSVYSPTTSSNLEVASQNIEGWKGCVTISVLKRGSITIVVYELI